MKKEKKGQVLLYGVFAGLIAAILVSIFSNASGKNFDVIGASSLILLETAKKAESSLFYIDQSAKYSLQQAVYELARNGGAIDVEGIDEIDSAGAAVIDTSAARKGCGKFKGASVWYEIKRDYGKQAFCFNAEDIPTNLEYTFNKNLNGYLSNYPLDIPVDNYNYEIKGSLEITGKAVNPLKFNIQKDEEKQAAKQPVKTSISQIQDGFVDFTGTELCKKGKKCQLTKVSYDLLLEAEKKAKEILREKKIKAACLEDEKAACLEVTSGYRTLEEQSIEWRRNPDSRHVCPPSPTCPHLTGNVIDIRFKGKEMTSKEWSLLHIIMSQVGWVRYSKEPWHFECCGTVRYARAKSQGVTEIA